MNLKESFYDGPIVRTLKHALSLLVVFLLLASTAVWTGRLFGHDIGQPADGAKLMPSLLPPDAALLKEMGLNEAEVKLSVRDSASWLVMKQADHSPVGIIVNSLPYAKNVKGFAGPTPLYIYLDAEGVIRGTAVGDNAESADFLQRTAHGTLVHWIGLTPQAGTHLKVDAVSGATYSSRALIANMQQCLGAVTAASTPSASEPVAGWGRTLAVCAVLLAGMLAAWRLRGKKWVRIGVLVLNVAVLGFWSGQFLSLSLLRGWIANGLDPLAYLPMVCVLGVALIMPFFGRHRHYCTWVCPYGSLQELAGRLPLPKIPCSPRVFRIMSRVRMGVLSLLLLLLWTGVGGFLLNYEPFTFFAYQSVPPVVMVLGLLFVVASCFVPNLWCKACCPVGALLDLSDK